MHCSPGGWLAQAGCRRSASVLFRCDPSPLDRHPARHSASHTSVYRGSVGAALLPLALALCAILTVSFLSQLRWQAKFRIGASRCPSQRPPPPRRHSYAPPTGRPPGPPSTPTSRALSDLRSSSRRDHVQLLRAALAAAAVVELAPITAVHRALLVTAFFVLGAIAIGSTAPPPAEVSGAVALAAMPARWRLPRPPWRALTGGGLARRACFAAGGLARQLPASAHTA